MTTSTPFIFKCKHEHLYLLIESNDPGTGNFTYQICKSEHLLTVKWFKSFMVSNVSSKNDKTTP